MHRLLATAAVGMVVVGGLATRPLPPLPLPLAQQPAAAVATANQVVLYDMAELVSAKEPAAPEPVVVPRATARQADIPVAHVWQSLNNCGPASVTMILSSMGIRVSQEEARIPLRGTNVLRGMGPGGVDPWVNSRFGLHAFARNNGTAALMKALVSNGFAPMVTQWLYDPPSRVSHWRVVRGYDDDAGVFYAADPMRGAAVPLGYQWFDDNWRPFQYRYLVIYRPEDAALLRTILGSDWNDVPSRFNYLARAKDEALRINNSEAWLSYGEAAYQVGRIEESVAAFERGMLLGSANGVFNVRSSYPAALRLLGREDDARAATARLASTSRVPTTTPDPAELRAVQAAGGFPAILFRLPDPNQPPVPARFAADPVVAR